MISMRLYALDEDGSGKLELIVRGTTCTFECDL